MAANISLSYPNFTLTPQAGAFGTINRDDSTTILRIKNSSGGLISDYTLSSNIHPDNELIGIEYCGPLNLSEMIDNVTFFTVEKVNSTQCIIKRWETNVGFSLLSLKQQIVKYTTGNFYYDLNSMAVEHYHRTFNFSQPAGQSYININSASRIKTGDTLFLGPSNDFDNIGATEKVTVSNVVGNIIYLNSPTVYQYAFGDKITFFNNIYLISNLGYAGDVRYGTIFKHDAYSGARLEYTTGGEYSRITGARWSTEVAAVACINKSQLLFIRPYDSYLKWKSMFLNNITSGNDNYFEVYDVVFDNTVVYKLAKSATTKDDNGNKTTESWSKYNYQQDSLLPYTHNVSIYTKQQNTIGSDSTRIYVQTRDQFGVGLRDVNINLYDDGSDLGANFSPLNGQAITDIDGNADVGYIPGGLYTGPTIISVKADKSSSFTGSQYCWNSILIDGKVEFFNPFGEGAMFQRKQTLSELSSYQIDDPYKVALQGPGTSIILDVPPIIITCYSYFGTPGGNWYEENDNYSYSCWPWFQTTPEREDGPIGVNTGCKWGCISWPRTPSDPIDAESCQETGYSPRSGFITQITNFTQVGVHPEYYLEDPLDEDMPPEKKLTADSRPLILKQPVWYWQYNKNITCNDNSDCIGLTGCCLNNGQPVPIKLFQIADAVHYLQMSQLNLSKHNYLVDGSYSSTLNTNVRLDQFIFVEDAVPGFFSEKNPRETDIWIRMRPFAFSLNGDTLKFYVREMYSVNNVYYDTGYYDVIERYGWPPNNDRVTLEYFDAGGGALGVEFRYDNPDIYHHNALVYVHIEIFDTAAEPNYIYTDYWFRIIPDYKSPYLENEDPGREEDQVALDTKLYFEIKDDGEGVDISSLEVYLNSRIVYHAGMTYNPNTVIEKINLNHYKVTIDLPYNLQYGKNYSVNVVVKDISENKNILRDSYRFYTRYSEVPWFTNFDPKLCKRGMPKFKDVSFIVLGAGDGVDEQTIRIQVHDQDVTNKSKITPVIYRIS
jgi:hypothetical protein